MAESGPGALGSTPSASKQWKSEVHVKSQKPVSARSPLREKIIESAAILKLFPSKAPSLNKRQQQFLVACPAAEFQQPAGFAPVSPNETH